MVVDVPPVAAREGEVAGRLHSKPTVAARGELHQAVVDGAHAGVGPVDVDGSRVAHRREVVARGEVAGHLIAKIVF